MARTRSPEAHEKVLHAAIELFAERGIDAASMDAIAEVSGVSKATIYKYWANKDSVCLEALSYLFGADSKHPVPDTGDLRADLVARLSHHPAEDRRQVRERIMPHVMAYAAKNHAFGKAWRSQAMAPLITALTDWIRREQSRKQLSERIDLECAIAMLVGPLLFRNIFKREQGSRKVYAPNLEASIAEAFLAMFAT
jgi:AcrR family transcriptional regulator